MFNKPIFIKNAISKERAKIICDYLMLKEKVANRLMADGYIPHNACEWGTFNDTFVDRAFSMYSDILCENLLKDLVPLMEKKTGMKLIPMYSYARVYHKGSELFKHIDRRSCAVSTTLFAGGDKWSFFYRDEAKEVEVKFNPGDMLIYDGPKYTHWRKPFKKKNCVQIFLHYNEKKKGAKLNDGRPFLGLPKDYYGQ
tara:strand:- start:2732 stop:3322 length:591 start_codon:yes stop_codon:yes gene_type:complete